MEDHGLRYASVFMLEVYVVLKQQAISFNNAHVYFNLVIKLINFMHKFVHVNW